jgi:hypothetical protein
MIIAIRRFFLISADASSMSHPHDLLLALFVVEAVSQSRAFKLVLGKMFLYFCGTQQRSKSKYS